MINLTEARIAANMVQLRQAILGHEINEFFKCVRRGEVSLSNSDMRKLVELRYQIRKKINELEVAKDEIGQTTTQLDELIVQAEHIIRICTRAQVSIQAVTMADGATSIDTEFFSSTSYRPPGITAWVLDKQESHPIYVEQPQRVLIQQKELLKVFTMALPTEIRDDFGDEIVYWACEKYNDAYVSGGGWALCQVVIVELLGILAVGAFTRLKRFIPYFKRFPGIG